MKKIIFLDDTAELLQEMDYEDTNVFSYVLERLKPKEDIVLDYYTPKEKKDETCVLLDYKIFYDGNKGTAKIDKKENTLEIGIEDNIHDFLIGTMNNILDKKDKSDVYFFIDVDWGKFPNISLGRVNSVFINKIREFGEKNKQIKMQFFIYSAHMDGHIETWQKYIGDDKRIQAVQLSKLSSYHCQKSLKSVISNIFEGQ